jgi:hypothetical protein
LPQRSQRDSIIVLLCAAALSVASLIYFYQLGATNLYGDGIAHLNIARKIFDLDNPSLWTRYVQLGSPWLPLPHLFALLFVWNDELWRTGLAGSFVSMICYVLTTLLVFEMGAKFGGVLQDRAGEKDLRSGLLAAAIFALNPSLLYMQTTPMTELPFLAGVAWAVYLLLRWSEQERTSSLVLAGFAASLATLTRYEAWAIIPAGSLLILALSRGNFAARFRASLIWSAVAMTGPLYWLWHNWAIYNNAFEFYNGFYSPGNYLARFRERLSWAEFVMGSFGYAALIGTAAAGVCSGLFLVLSSYGAFIKTLIFCREQWRKRSPEIVFTGLLFLLAAPYLFMVYSLYTGNTQIYPLSAIALLNVRYGLNALLAVAVFPVIWLRGARPKMRFAVMLLFIVAQYGWMLADGADQLGVYQEPYRNVHNIREGRAYAKLEAYLREHPPSAKIMMHSGGFGPSILRSNLRFRDIVFEGLSVWHEPMNELPASIQSVIVMEGDQLWKRLKESNFERDFELVYTVEPSPRLMVWRRRGDKDLTKR